MQWTSYCPQMDSFVSHYQTQIDIKRETDRKTSSWITDSEPLFPISTVVQPSLVASQQSGQLYLERRQGRFKPQADCMADSLTRIEVYLKNKKNPTCSV